MQKMVTRFSPIDHGFAFRNLFAVRLPVKYKLPLGGTIDLNDVSFGLCGGMCFAALDYFHAGLPRPEFETVDQLDRPTFVYLCDRQLDSLKISIVFKFLEWMLLEDSELAARMARAEIPKLRRQLAKGEPAVLGLVRVRGVSDPTRNHQVLAVGCDENEETRSLVIHLYDPNHPNETPELHVQLSRPTAAFRVAQSTGEALRGFFIIPYRPQKNVPRPTPPQVPAFEPTAAPIQLFWPVDSRRVNQFFGAHPESYRPFGLPGHEGLDLFAPSGANVYAAADGVVEKAGFPPNHPYGLHVRLRHTAGDTAFTTIYGHLSKVFVSDGQPVTAGERIGLADNTGNSFGSHLHITLKIDGKQTPGYPPGIVDPWLYLKDASAAPIQPEKPLPPPSGVTVFTTASVNLRAGPATNAEVLAVLPPGEQLMTLGQAEDIHAKIGIEGAWLQVQTVAGRSGYVAAWLVESSEQPFPPSNLVVYPYDAANLRSGPGAGFDQIAVMTSADPLTVLGDSANARAKLGRKNEWLQVQTAAGQRGFVAAWLVHLTGETPPLSGLTVFPITGLNVRARPLLDANILTVTTPDDALSVLGDPDAARARVGVEGEWLNVRTPTKFAGYVAAWLVRLDAPLEPAAPVAKLVVFATEGLNLRAQASINSPRVGGLPRGEAFTVLETNLDSARARLGQEGQWIFGQKASGERGWAAAWFLSATPL